MIYELDIYGLYFAPLLIWAAAAWFTMPMARIAARSLGMHRCLPRPVIEVASFAVLAGMYALLFSLTRIS